MTRRWDPAAAAGTEKERSIAGHDPGGDGFCLAPLPVVRRRIGTAVNGSSLDFGLTTAVTAAGQVETVSAAVKRLPGANLDHQVPSVVDPEVVVGALD